MRAAEDMGMPMPWEDLPWDGGGDRSDFFPGDDERDGGAAAGEGASIRAAGLASRVVAAVLVAWVLSSCASYTRTADGTQHLGLVATNATRVELRADGSLVVDGVDQGTPSREALKIWGILNIGRSLVSAADNAVQDALSTE